MTGDSVPDPGDKVPPEDRMDDDEKFYFGTDQDVSALYDSAAGEFRIRSEVAPDWAIRIDPGGQLRLQSPGANWTVIDNNLNLSGNDLIGVTRLRMRDNAPLYFGYDQDISFQYDSANAKLKVAGPDFVDETADGMTANPEADTEDGFLTIEIGTNVYQIPIYSA